MRINKIIPSATLMIVTILVIIGFQVYWLKDNYDREKKSLQIKTNVAFQQVMQKLQVSKLHLPEIFQDSTQKGKHRIFINESITQSESNPDQKNGRQIITMVNALTTKLHDSLKVDTAHSTFVIKLDKSNHANDSLPIKFRKYFDTSDHVNKIWYRIDSLQDSIKVPEINNFYSSELKNEKLDVPFIITKFKGTFTDDEQDISYVTIGFAHPVTYHVTLKNIFPYLLKKLALPILFSIFLIGVTVFSFLLLYRNLLRQQRLSAIKNDFISNITHELKTPLATVGVAIEALKNFNAMHDSEKTKEYLDISGNELQRLNLLVDKVLKLSMFEKKQIDLNKENFDLKQLIQKVLDSMKLQFEKNNAVVNFNADGNEFIINADKLHITSVVYNVIDNALKYSFDNPTINVHLSQKQNALELKVTDNGIGIAAEYRKKIFDKFFRVPTGNKHAVKGYGLGLSYVSEIIDRHNGAISVESDTGKGSSFIVSLPVQSS